MTADTGERYLVYFTSATREAIYPRDFYSRARAPRVLHFIARQLDISNTPSADVLVIPRDVTRVVFPVFFFCGPSVCKCENDRTFTIVRFFEHTGRVVSLYRVAIRLLFLGHRPLF